MMFWQRKTPAERAIDFDRARRAIVQVGSGRGFVIGQHIATTASCLPYLPPFRPFDYDRPLEYGNILGSLGEPLTAPAQCEHLEIISNVAVLREIPPELQDPPPAKEYDEDGFLSNWSSLTNWEMRYLIRSPRRSSIAGAETSQAVWILSLDNDWVQCTAKNYSNFLCLEDVPFDLDGRLSGSPIVDENGAAIAILSAPIDDNDREEWLAHHQHTCGVLSNWYSSE